MSKVDSPPADQSPRRFRFSLHTLLVVLTLTSVALGVWNLENTGWSDLLRAVATALMLFGVGEQIHDLQRTWRTKRLRDEQLACAWEVVWRVVLITVLVAFAVATIYDRIVFSDKIPFAHFLARHPAIGWQLTLLILLLELFSPPVRRATTLRENSHTLLIFGGIFVLSWLVASGTPTLEFLVMAAIRGVQGAQATQRHGAPFYPFEPSYERWEQFKLAGYCAVPVLGAAFVSGWVAIKSTRRWLRVSSGLLMALLLGVLFAGNWWADSELWALIPFRHPSDILQNRYQTGTLLAIAALFTTAATVVLLREMPQVKSWPTLCAGLRPLGSYTHERIFPLALIGITTLQPALEDFYQHVRLSFGPWGGFAGSFAGVLCDPPVLLSLLNGWVVLRTLLRLRKPQTRERAPLTLRPFQLWQACIVWTLVVILLFMTLATFYWSTWAYLMWDYGGQF